MTDLIIEAPERVSDTTFKITINDKEYEYEVAEDKNIDAVIDKINTWLARGEESYGGLYDYIKRSFKLVGEYEEPIEEPVEEIDEGPEEIDLPSDQVDIEEPVVNQLDIDVNIDEKEVSVTINEWSAKFTLLTDEEEFTDMLSEYIVDEMSLRDRTELIVQLAGALEANDMVDFYNLINLILDTGVDIVNSFDEAEEEVEEAPTDNFEETPIEDNDMDLDFQESEKLEGKMLTEDFEDDTEMMGTSIEDMEDENKSIPLEELIKNQDFIDDLISLDLSLFELTNAKDKEDKIYFIGGINNTGNKFSLSYSTEPPIELVDDFDKLKELEVCLNNRENLEDVVSYIDKLLDIVYNKELKDMEENNE